MRILRRDNVREGFDSVRGLVRERVLFNMPIKLLQRINDIIPDLSVIRSVRYRGAKPSLISHVHDELEERKKRTHEVWVSGSWKDASSGRSYQGSSERR